MHVLACIDLSETTPPLVEAATALAGGLSAELTLLHVAAPEPDFVGYDVGPASVRDAVAGELRAEHRQLDQWRQRTQQAGVNARALMVQGSTVEAILSHAQRLAVGYVVLGNRSSFALRDLVFGSTTRGVLKGAKSPVVIIPLELA